MLMIVTSHRRFIEESGLSIPGFSPYQILVDAGLATLPHQLHLMNIRSTSVQGSPGAPVVAAYSYKYTNGSALLGPVALRSLNVKQHRAQFGRFKAPVPDVEQG